MGRKKDIDEVNGTRIVLSTTFGMNLSLIEHSSYKTLSVLPFAFSPLREFTLSAQSAKRACAPFNLA